MGCVSCPWMSGGVGKLKRPVISRSVSPGSRNPTRNAISTKITRQTPSTAKLPKSCSRLYGLNQGMSAVAINESPDVGRPAARSKSTGNEPARDASASRLPDEIEQLVERTACERQTCEWQYRSEQPRRACRKRAAPGLPFGLVV